MGLLAGREASKGVRCLSWFKILCFEKQFSFSSEGKSQSVTVHTKWVAKVPLQLFKLLKVKICHYLYIICCKFITLDIKSSGKSKSVSVAKIPLLLCKILKVKICHLSCKICWKPTTSSIKSFGKSKSVTVCAKSVAKILLLLFKILKAKICHCSCKLCCELTT